MKNAFYFTLKILFVLKIFKFCPDLLDHVGKFLDRKAKVNFRNYNVINWETNNYNTAIAKYLKNQRQSDNEFWSVNTIQRDKYFSLKIMQEMKQEN